MSNMAHGHDGLKAPNPGGFKSSFLVVESPRAWWKVRLASWNKRAIDQRDPSNLQASQGGWVEEGAPAPRRRGGAAAQAKLSEIIWLTDKLEEAFSCSLCCIRTLSVGNAINIVVSPKSGIFSLDFSCILLCCLLNVYRSDEDRTEQKFYMHWTPHLFNDS